jgi:hypothetical protein
MVKQIEFTYGVSIDIYEPSDDPEKPPKQKKYRLTGRYPSPAYADLEALVNAAVDFFNGHLDTKFMTVRAYSEDEVEEVAVGEWQPKKPRKKKVRNEKLESVVA